MAKDRFEDFIDNHRADFDQAAPEKDLWSRIAEELAEEKKKPKKWPAILYKAASVILIASISILIYESFDKDPVSNPIVAETDNPEEVSPVIQELEEIEMYYGMEIETKLKELHQYASYFPEVEEEANEDLEDLDNAFEELKDDLNDAVANEEVLEAMIQNYRLKLELLEGILHQLKKFKEDESEYNENDTHI